MAFILSVVFLLIGPWFGLFLVRVSIVNKRIESKLNQAPEQEHDTTDESAARTRIL